jgi:Flp pilus assembly protein TadD
MALVSYARYVGKFFWPANLSAIYPVEIWPVWAVAGSAVLVLCFSTASLLLRKRAPYALVGWFWFLGTLVPVIGLVAFGEQSMADRYTYFPLIGFSMVLVWGAEQMTKPWRNRQPALGIACAGMLVAGALASRQQTRVWKDSVTLFTHAVAATPRNYSAHANLTTALQEQGRLEEALVHAREAARLRPDSPETLNNLGASLGMVGQQEEAIAVFRSALNLKPDYAEAHRNLAVALGQRGNLPEAIEHYVEALRLKPGQAQWFNDFGLALASAGRMDEAIVQFYKAVQIDPRSASAHNNLGKALLQQGRTEEAGIHFQAATRLNRSGSVP